MKHGHRSNSNVLILVGLLILLILGLTGCDSGTPPAGQIVAPTATSGQRVLVGTDNAHPYTLQDTGQAAYIVPLTPGPTVEVVKMHNADHTQRYATKNGKPVVLTTQTP